MKWIFGMAESKPVSLEAKLSEFCAVNSSKPELQVEKIKGTVNQVGPLAFGNRRLR